MGEPTSDVELLQAWGRGDRAAGNELFVRHFAGVFRFFRAKLGTAADELTQKTFLGAVENAARIDPARGVRGYLFGIARKQLLMHLRSARREAARFDPESWSLAQVGLGAVEIVARQREQLLLARAMSQLPLDYQCTLELYYWNGLEIAEIAEALEAPTGTIKARLSRARQLLRAAIEATAESAELARSTVGGLDHWLAALPDAIPRDRGESW